MRSPSTFRWGYALCAALAALAVLIAMAYLYMVIYGHVLHTGETQAFYERHAQKASPVVAFLLGPLVFYLLGRAAPNPRTAYAAWGIFAFISCAAILLTEAPLQAAMLCLIDLPVKGMATWWGARSHSQHATA